MYMLLYIYICVCLYNPVTLMKVCQRTLNPEEIDLLGTLRQELQKHNRSQRVSETSSGVAAYLMLENLAYFSFG